MIRIRLHGRGGQGIKTASQILGTAAFLSDFQAQDFPLYGAERRGAPIVAFTRIAYEPVLERGPVTRPDLLLIGDETLLEDAQAAPLCGADENTVVFINSGEEGVSLKKRLSLPKEPITLNLTDLCFEKLGRGNILSSALAAAGARLLGCIPFDKFIEAMKSELIQQGLAADILQKNRDLVEAVFNKLSTVTLQMREAESLEASALVAPEIKRVEDSAPIILAPGNMVLRKTGNWRTERPVIDYDQCNKCLICYARCPDGAIHIGTEGKPEIDYDHCKGCLICSRECPGHHIQTVRESEVK